MRLSTRTFVLNVLLWVFVASVFGAMFGGAIHHDDPSTPLWAAFAGITLLTFCILAILVMSGDKPFFMTKIEADEWARLCGNDR